MTREEEISKASIDYAERQTAGILGIEKQIAISSYEAGAEWADGHPINPWHSVADGDLPSFDDIVLINSKEYGVITARYDKGWEGVEVPLFYSADCARTAEEVDYWMEIPQLPK